MTASVLLSALHHVPRVGLLPEQQGQLTQQGNIHEAGRIRTQIASKGAFIVRIWCTDTVNEGAMPLLLQPCAPGGPHPADPGLLYQYLEGALCLLFIV